jgi:hypothetical protein
MDEPERREQVIVEAAAGRDSKVERIEVAMTTHQGPDDRLRLERRT